MFTYATVCSGVEGCSLALRGMDWTPIFFSEIEPFPCAVLKYHYPHVPNLGDISKISYDNEKGIITNGTTNIRFSGRLDLIAGGSPCQDFSVAGKRSGGAKGSGTRSSLMWEWLRLAEELRPRILLWENVVGTFSSNGGRDFYEFVRAIDALGYMCQWRVLDAQFVRTYGTSPRALSFPFAIPQRRRRVWLVASLGGDVTEFAKILFESPSIAGNPPTRKVEREDVANTSQDGNRSDVGMVGGRNYGIGNGQINCACAPAEEASQTLDCMDDPQKIMQVCSTGKDVASTLSADDGTRSGQDYKSNSVIEAFNIPSMNSNVMKSPNPSTGVKAVEVFATLDSTPPSPHKNQGGDMIVECFENHPNDSRVSSSGDCVQTLTQRIGTGGGNLPLIVRGVEGVDGYNFAETGEVSADIVEATSRPLEDDCIIF